MSFAPWSCRNVLPLDCHAHIDPGIHPSALDELGACVVAVTRSLDEYARVAKRRDSATAWALGAHPSLRDAHESFDADCFRRVLEAAPLVGEIGLDGRSKVPMDVQRGTLEAILLCLAESPRMASVHSVAATGLVLEALIAHRIKGIVLHWWRGTESETRRALDLGCYFSLNVAEVAKPKILNLIPRERVLTETDHPFGDRLQSPPRRPGRVHDVEVALAARWGVDIKAARRQVWDNFRCIALETGTVPLLPATFQRTMLAA